MRRKLPWPFIAVISCSFLIGALWGWKIIHERTSEAGRLEAESKLRILAPPGLFSQPQLLEFQRQEKIEVEVTTEAFPASLLRRALKSAPGQFDAVILFHHQVSELRAERKLAPLYDTRVKFPTTIAPDFRKLPNDRNLMDTAPILWGLIGEASKKEFEGQKAKLGFWPSFLIGLEETSLTALSFAAKLQGQLHAPASAGGAEGIEAQMKKGLGAIQTAPTSPMIVSHGSLAFSPLKELGLTFRGLKSGDGEVYPLWILTVASLVDGDTERTRRFVRFLLEPLQNVAFVQGASVGATTLREHDGLETLPATLQAAHFRTFPIDKIQIERDERVRGADEVLEQVILGANLKLAKPAETPRPGLSKGHAKAPVKALHEESHDDEGDEADVPAAPATGVTAPSGPQPHDD